jgi:hypothetical protein
VAALAAAPALAGDLDPGVEVAFARWTRIAPRRPKGQLVAARIIAARVVVSLCAAKLAALERDFERDLSGRLGTVVRRIHEKEISGEPCAEPTSGRSRSFSGATRPGVGASPGCATCSSVP